MNKDDMERCEKLRSEIYNSVAILRRGIYKHIWAMFVLLLSALAGGFLVLNSSNKELAKDFSNTAGKVEIMCKYIEYTDIGTLDQDLSKIDSEESTMKVR